jgi:hypothetical protein
VRIQDPVGCFAQIERSEAAIEAALASQEAICFLILKTDEPLPEVELLTTQGWRKFVSVLQAINDLEAQGLLEILHSSRLLSNDSGSLVRLRNGSDLYRHFRTRLEKLNTVQLVVIGELRESVISVRKHTLQSKRPLTDRILRVSAKPISRSPRTVPGNESVDTGWVDDFALRELIEARADHTPVTTVQSKDYVQWIGIFLSIAIHVWALLRRVV